MSTIRQERVSQLLFQELSILIGHELDDPQLSLLSVTNVDVSRDLRTVKVYVTHSDDAVSRRAVLAGLKNASPYMRRHIAQRCRLRVAPELIFYYDETPERVARVDELLRRIRAEREERASVHEPGDVAPGSNPEQAEESGV